MFRVAHPYGPLRAVVLCACLLLAPAVQADLTVGAGGLVSLGNGALHLGCSDINVAGSGLLRLDSAPVDGARNVTIQPGGVLDFGTGSIAVAGTFTNRGTMLNVRPGSIVLVNDPACAPGGPSIVDTSPTPVPALGAAGLSLLALLISSLGILMTWRRTGRVNERE